MKILEQLADSGLRRARENMIYARYAIYLGHKVVPMHQRSGDVLANEACGASRYDA